MAMSTGRPGSTIGEINITPMIDVLLVLLVIFMLAQPLLQRSVDVQLPVEKRVTDAAAPAIVLEIGADGALRLNTRPVRREDLGARLQAVYAGRADKVLFVKAAGAVPYGEVVGAMDVARGAGVEVLGAVLPPSGPPGS